MQCGRSNSNKCSQVFAFDRTVSRLLEMQSVDYVRCCLETRPFGKEFVANILGNTPHVKHKEIEELWNHYRIGSKDEIGASHHNGTVDGKQYLHADSYLVALSDIANHCTNHSNDHTSEHTREIVERLKQNRAERIGFEDFEQSIQSIFNPK